MKKRLLSILGILALMLPLVFVTIPVTAQSFTHAPVVRVDGKDYWFDGAPDGPGGAKDVPGHEWAQVKRNQLEGRHYNTGPFGAPKWWSSDSDNGTLLYEVDAIIDTWSLSKAAQYASRGYVHYHELVLTSDGITKHPKKVVWLKHTAVDSFTLDGGPHPELSHPVTPGIDYHFINNWFMPYSP